MQVTGKIHALKHLFSIPLGNGILLPRFVYSFIIFSNKNVYLIDSGVNGSDIEIIKYIQEQGYKTGEIKLLILTHSHPDHIGGAKIIKDLSGCSVLAHDGEKEWIEDIEKQFSDRPVPGFKNLVNKSVRIDRFLADKEIIEAEEGISFEIIHTPGHSKGSISISIKEEGALISGDSILLPGELPIYEDVISTISSINKLKQIDNVKILLSSWDEPVSGEMILNKMHQSVKYLISINNVIKGIENAKEYSPIELCKIVIEKMNLPQAAINPLTAKSFQSNLCVPENHNF